MNQSEFPLYLGDEWHEEDMLCLKVVGSELNIRHTYLRVEVKDVVVLEWALEPALARPRGQQVILYLFQ